MLFLKIECYRGSKDNNGHNGRRDRHDIVADLLKGAMFGEKKTILMSKANLSFSQLGGYLDNLLKHGYLEVDGKKLKTTKTGLKVIDAYNLMESV